MVPRAKQPWSWLKERWRREGGKESTGGETGLGLTLCVVAVVSGGEVWEQRRSSSSAAAAADVTADEISERSESGERSSASGAELSAMNGGEERQGSVGLRGGQGEEEGRVEVMGGGGGLRRRNCVVAVATGKWQHPEGKRKGSLNVDGC